MSTGINKSFEHFAAIAIVLSRLNGLLAYVYTSNLRLIAVPVSVALLASLAIGAWAAGPQTSTKSAAKKKSVVASKASTTKAVAKSAPAKTPVKPPVKSAATTAKKGAPAAKRPVAVVHHSPQQPAPERLKEIQQALASKGYFDGEPDGAWGASSIVALKHFQHDQNLQEDGKIGSLSLIALGLGPKREIADSSPKTVEPEQKNP